MGEERSIVDLVNPVLLDLHPSPGPNDSLMESLTPWQQFETYFTLTPGGSDPDISVGSGSNSSPPRPLPLHQGDQIRIL